MDPSSSPEAGVLLVDDEPALLASGRTILQSAGLKRVTVCGEAREVPSVLRDGNVAVVVLDLKMPGLGGYDLLQLIRQEFPHISVIIMTGTAEIETAVECMKAGAFDYLVKPVEGSRFVASVKRALEITSLRREMSILKHHLLSGQVENEKAFAAMKTGSESLLAIFRYIEAVAPSRQPLLICGETGVGKELAARAVHAVSGVTGDFVAVNIAGLDDTMFSDTLFGHRRGAFTGAESGREGLIARAGGGTLFLDEIGDLSPPSQIKLLRLIQEMSYLPLGADTPRSVDARVVVATHRDPQAMIDEGTFRKDLFYRLSTHQITIPPLRDRMDDLPLLVDHFLAKASDFLGKKAPTPPRELYTLLSTYPFPGNVRELENMVFDAVAQHQGGILSMESFRKALGSGNGSEGEVLREKDPGEDLAELFGTHLPTLKEAEQALIQEALRRAEGNQGVAARILGISRQALNKRLIRAEGLKQGGG